MSIKIQKTISIFLSIILLTQITSQDANQLKVTLKIFSGAENPSWKISENIQFIKELINTNIFSPKQDPTDYAGFSIEDESTSEKIEVFGNPKLETLLLQSIPSSININKTIKDFILEKISTGFVKKTKIQELFDKAKKEFKKLELNKLADVNCNNTPIREGHNGIPKYDPYGNHGGCYIVKEEHNNCYNYGTHVITNTFAQPGYGSTGQRHSTTCSGMINGSIKDGLKYIGMKLPSNQPAVGHYVALILSDYYDFHWLRKDSNGLWSHKPGSTPIINTDRNGNLIYDPSIQKISFYDKFCGYFLVVPTNINIQ